MPRGAEAFHTTHWSVILRAKNEDGAEAEAALEKLCRTYWPPLYRFIRREGYGLHDAQELTQEFLSRFVHKEWLNHLQHQNGKFRSFLLTFLKHFLSDVRDRANARKRGGGQEFISLDSCADEEGQKFEPADGLTADQIYDRRWAHAVMSRAAERLREEYAARGKAALFEQIKDIHPGEHGERNYAEVGATVGMSEQAIKNAVHAFRRRYRELVRDEVAQTVSEASLVDDEIRYLMSVFSG